MAQRETEKVYPIQTWDQLDADLWIGAWVDESSDDHKYVYIHQTIMQVQAVKSIERNAPADLAYLLDRVAELTRERDAARTALEAVLELSKSAYRRLNDPYDDVGELDYFWQRKSDEAGDIAAAALADDGEA